MYWDLTPVPTQLMKYVNVLKIIIVKRREYIALEDAEKCDAETIESEGMFNL